MWQPIETAPKDGTRVIVLSADFGPVCAWWDVSVKNFYKSQEGWASYDPENNQGDWVSEWRIGKEDERRLYCGCTPKAWMPIPLLITDNGECGMCNRWVAESDEPHRDWCPHRSVNCEGKK